MEVAIAIASAFIAPLKDRSDLLLRFSFLFFAGHCREIESPQVKGNTYLGCSGEESHRPAHTAGGTLYIGDAALL
jgi:hypothetical protein